MNYDCFFLLNNTNVLFFSLCYDTRCIMIVQYYEHLLDLYISFYYYTYQSSLWKTDVFFLLIILYNIELIYFFSYQHSSSQQMKDFFSFLKE